MVEIETSLLMIGRDYESEKERGRKREVIDRAGG